MFQVTPPQEPLLIIPGPNGKIDFAETDGGLPPVANAQSATVCRANPSQSDAERWTFHHFPDIACWKGRLYVAWNSTKKDENGWPSRELYSTSEDGERWSAPVELFPEGASTPLRMFFYRAQNGTMLALAGLRTSKVPMSQLSKTGLVVREVQADHKLGAVYTLRKPPTLTLPISPLFTAASDSRFVEACQELLANRLFLQQQDYGSLLAPEERIPWHEPRRWTGQGDALQQASDFGKAMCFFRRPDKTIVGIGTKGWVTTSPDDGRTWTQPVRPRSFITGTGRVWGQRTPRGGYLLAYNPHGQLRFPLVVVTGDDGQTFRDMRRLNGTLPEVRYTGVGKEQEASYPRGLTEWSTDGSRKDDFVWLVYSVNKEEIRAVRLAL